MAKATRKPAAKRPARKTAAKKPARKTAAKKPARKTAARKPARKSAVKKPARKTAARKGVKRATRKPAKTVRAKKTAADRTITHLEKFVANAWDSEPADIGRLRKHALPPMGNLPCMFYANFNTFWMGENVQVLRQLALDRALPVRALNTMAAALLARHAARLAKWNMTDTVKLAKRLIRFFEGEGAKSPKEFVRVCEAIMLASDRMNAWIDAALPWSALDRKLKPFPPMK